ncbi:MAG: tRNA (adenosine(37)-N6)-threonylcarbamoyltransferase complex ATPase subunit type 1 TsaE [Verrucomicrobiaceae bacterium]|nr:MAG: tRNA (adenosine(37)-N6)-threonylcarbamoyltransferase complex ATPase subunit type 1 TsaE [Verrucomicrobiaceae bacterium]
MSAAATPILLHTIEDTLALGRELGMAARAGDVIALCGGLGSGKTHLSKGITAGAGSLSEVTSPTFTLVHEYRGGRIPVFHFDFYRMSSADEVLGLGWDEYLEAGGLCLVEWADLFPALLPEGTAWWRLLLNGETGIRTALRLGGAPEGPVL